MEKLLFPIWGLGGEALEAVFVGRREGGGNRRSLFFFWEDTV